MRILSCCLFLFLVVFASSCKDDERSEDEYTGRVLVYPLLPGSDYNTSGTVTFREMQDSSIQVAIVILPTGADVLHPAHLHYGPYQKDAEMAAMLSPVDGKTGKSTTNIKRLADGTLFTFPVLKNFDGHVKVHGDDGANKDVILAYGNIGANAIVSKK